MSLPITIPLLQIEIKEVIKADSKPTPPNGYKVVLIEDLTFTKLWLVYKIVQ